MCSMGTVPLVFVLETEAYSPFEELRPSDELQNNTEG